MSISSRFAVAVHTLTLLALNGEEPVTSEEIASSVNTHPVVIRRLLGRLRQAGLVTSQPGVGGGAMLARRAEEITLLAVFRAVEATQLFALHQQPPDPECHCGRHIQPVMSKVFLRVEGAVEQELANVTLAQVVQEVQGATTARAALVDDRLRSQARQALA
jgi:Rrf2 family protein